MIKTRSRIAAVFLTLAMTFAMLPMSVFAASDSPTQTTVIETETSDQDSSDASRSAYAGQSTAKDDSDTSDSTTQDFSSSVKDNEFSWDQVEYEVTSVFVTGSTAFVSYSAETEALLVVSIFYDNDYACKLVGSGHATVSADEKTVEVSLSADLADVPSDEYLVEAYLIHPTAYYPLSYRYSSWRDNPSYVPSDDDDDDIDFGPHPSIIYLPEGIAHIKGEGTMVVKDGILWKENTEASDNLKSVIIYPGVTSICDDAFISCVNLSSVTIPTTVTSIGRQAFFKCTELSTIYYEGTDDQWHAIDITDGNDVLGNANIVYNTEIIDDSDPDAPGSGSGAALPASGSSDTVAPITDQSPYLLTLTPKAIYPDYTHNFVDEDMDYRFARFDNVAPDTDYTFVVVKDSNAEDLFDPENVYYVGILHSDYTGEYLGAWYKMREEDDNAAIMIYGNPQESLCNATVTAPAVMYNGESQEPDITVTLNGKKLTKDEDYVVPFDGASNAGTYVFYVYGKGAYRDYATGTFSIMAPTLTLNLTAVTVQKDKTAEITGSFSPDDTGDAIVSWTSANEAIATVDEEGVITGVAKGKTTVTARAASGTTATVAVTVVDNAKPTTSITLKKTELSLTLSRSKLNPTATLSATIKGNSAGKTWYSDNPSVANVTSSGKVTAYKEGVANIYCRTADGTVSDPCVVTVGWFFIDTNSEDVVNNIAYVNKGQQIRLNVIGSHGGDVTWKSSNAKISDIVEISTSDDNPAIFSALKKGTVTITATSKTDKKVKDTLKLTVVEPTQTLAFNKSNKSSVYVGSTITLKTVVDKGTNDPISWESDNPLVATVTNKGVVKGVRQGTANITAYTAGPEPLEITVPITVRSKAQVLEMRDYVAGMVTEATGDTFTVDVASPSPCNDTITWTTSNAKVLAITGYSNDNRTISVKAGSKAGTATITAKSGSGKRVAVKVTVMNPTYTAEDITLNMTSADIYVGKSVTAKIKSVTPKTAKTSVAYWGSTDESVAKVDSTGKITGVGPGTAYIYCRTIDYLYKSFPITVRSKVTAINFDAASKTAAVGETIRLDGIITPEYSNDTLTWKSSSTKVAEIVSTSGSTAWVKGNAKGIATITLKAGSGKSKTIKVNVVNDPSVVSLTLWGSAYDQSFLRQTADAWAEEYADEHDDVSRVSVSVQVKGEDAAGEAAAKNPAAAADLYGVANDQIAALVQANAIKALSSDEAQSVADQDGESVFTSTLYNGSSYGFPYAPNTAEILYYNKDLYTDNEVASLNEMLAKDLGNNTINLGADINNSWNAMTWFATAGAELYTGGDKTVNTLNKPEVTNMFIWLKQQIDNEKIVDFDSSEEAVNLLKDRKVGAVFYGAWAAGQFEEALGDKLGVTALPSVTIDNVCYNQHLTCFGGSSLLVLNAKGKNTDAASSLAQYITNEQNQLKRFQMTGRVPVAPSLAETPEIASHAALAAEVAQGAYTITNDALNGTAEYWNLAGDFLFDFYNGNIETANLQTRLDAMVAQMQANVGA